MCAELTKLKKSRSAHRTHANRVMKSINELMQNIDLNDDFKVGELRGLKENYANQFSKIQELDSEILAKLPDDDVEEEILKSLEEKNVFYTILGRIEVCLNKAAEEISSTRTPSLPPSTSSRVDSELKVKLPKIELTKFSGEVEQWQTFWDQFQSAIHTKESLSDIDKFTYLKNLLTDTASDCISGLSLTSQNYKEAIDILKERYANPQIIISTHMEALVKLPYVRDVNNVKDLRKIYDKVESSIRNLKSLGINPDSYGSLLSPLLVEKLPEELRMIIARKFSDEIWRLEELMVYFKQELYARERCVSVTAKRSADQRTFDEATTSSFAVGSDNLSCVYRQGV